ncbi:MAG: hypothetical protein ACFFDO_04075 [Candidatus Thorarchaeota archaeon]
MFNRKKLLFLIIGTLIIIVMLSKVPTSSTNTYRGQYIEEYPRISASLEGSEKLIATSINRDAELNGYGVVNIVDSIAFKNLNTNPINSIFIGVPLSRSDDLVFFEATGEHENTLLSERAEFVMDEYEMIAIYFDTPLLPQQVKTIKFVQTYKDMLVYEKEEGIAQEINFTSIVLPVLPYKAEGQIIANFEIPSSSQLESNNLGEIQPGGKSVTYVESSLELEPFLENLAIKTIQIVFTDNTLTKLEVNEILREIHINPFGTIKVKEEYLIKNSGATSIDELSFEIPGPAKAITVYDDLGEILGVEVDPEENYFNLTYKDLTIDLSENRVKINPDTKFRFTIQYFLPFEKYVTLNWFQESIKMDVLTSIYQFLGKDQIIKIIIEGCFSLDYVSESTDAIEHTGNSLILVFMSDYVSPLERKEIQFTFTINFFDIALRPLIFIILIALISAAYVLIIKSRKEEAVIAAFRKELIPVNEIREFCSLLEEKSALILEIRQAEVDVKRKKIIKKKYKNILNKNTSKIQEIENEIVPFKKVVMEVNATFENLVKKIELLETERVSVKDSLNLLETRYKRGRLPSKTAYLKLSDNFLRRRKKIDRSIDKTIQQLRSYLL